jgi:plasmid replication initiation protein
MVPAEGNFEEHPYFRVGDRNSGTGVLRYEHELKTREGHILEQSWVVRAATGRGLPGRFDQDVYVALLQLIDEKGLPEDGWLSFSMYEIVQLMGRGHSGRDYRQIKDSLLRLASTQIDSNNAFYHGGRKKYITDSFSLLSQVTLSEYEDPDGHTSDRNAVLLSNYFLESYQANYLKNIDSRFYWSLSSPIAKRLYRLIDKKRGGRMTWQAGLFSLKDRIPLSDYKYSSKIKEKLAPAHAELIANEFLESVIYSKGSEGESAVYRISPTYHERRSIDSQSLSRDETFCVQRLKAEGMAVDTAEEMVVKYGAGSIMQYVEALAQQRNVRNPAGWLRKAIESGYELDLPPASSSSQFDNDLLPSTPKLDTHNTTSSEAQDAENDDDAHSLEVTNGTDAVSALQGDPNASSGFTSGLTDDCLDLGVEESDSLLAERLSSGEFADTISTLESLPETEYSRFVEAPTPIVSEDENRFFLSTDCLLYVYVGEVLEENLYYLCPINR